MDKIYSMLKAVIDNSVDEFIMGAGRRIDIQLSEQTVMVRDYGRGIPHENMIECLFGRLGGLHKIKIFSDEFAVRSIRNGEYREVRYIPGKRNRDETGHADELDGTLVTFTPCGDYSFQCEHVENLVWRYACVNSGLELYLNGKRFGAENGLRDLVRSVTSDECCYEPISFKSTAMEFAFCHARNAPGSYASFINGQHVSGEGAYRAIFEAGVMNAINKYFDCKYKVADIHPGLTGALALKFPQRTFSSNIEIELENHRLRIQIIENLEKEVREYLDTHPAAAELLLAKVAENVKLHRNRK